jgi:hypothetical protein
MPAEQEINRPRCRPLDDEPRGLVMRGGSGDILTQDLAIADEWEQFDNERLVKVFLAGVKQAATSSGTKLRAQRSQRPSTTLTMT